MTTEPEQTRPVILGVEVFAKVSSGMVDVTGRADSYEAFEAGALAQGILVAITETTFDPETGEAIETPTGQVRPAEGVNIDAIGPVVTTPAEVNAEGVQIAAAVIDERWHFNMRITGHSLTVPSTNFPGLLSWEETAYVWTAYGDDDLQKNRTEEGRTLGGVTLINPDTIKTPKRVWA